MRRNAARVLQTKLAKDMATPEENKIRGWLFPIMQNLLGVIALMLLNEMRNDLKTLTSSNISHEERIKTLEKDDADKTGFYQEVIKAYLKRDEQDELTIKKNVR